MKEILLTQSKVALVDEEDYERVSVFKWCAARCHRSRDLWYAVRHTPRCEGHRTVLLHRFLMNAPAGLTVDHKNGNGLDCRRDNMRIATQMQNNQNVRMKRDNSSGYRGVSASRGRWQAGIRIQGVSVFLGRYDSPEKAAQAYDQKVRETRGEFGRTNF